MSEQEQEAPKKKTKEQLKVIALRQRIGEITSDYENMIADMRASFTEQAEQMDEAFRSQYAQIQQLTREKADLEEALSKEGSKKPSDKSN